MPDFWRLLELRTASQFSDGLFQAGLAGALLFNPERAARPLAIAGAFAVLFLPYSLLGPFAGALMDRWDRRLVLVGANLGRLVSVALVGVCLAVGAGNLLVLCGALVVNGLARRFGARLLRGKRSLLARRISFGLEVPQSRRVRDGGTQPPQARHRSFARMGARRRLDRPGSRRAARPIQTRRRRSARPRPAKALAASKGCST